MCLASTLYDSKLHATHPPLLYAVCWLLSSDTPHSNVINSNPLPILLNMEFWSSQLHPIHPYCTARQSECSEKKKPKPIEYALGTTTLLYQYWCALHRSTVRTRRRRLGCRLRHITYSTYASKRRRRLVRKVQRMSRWFSNSCRAYSVLRNACTAIQQNCSTSQEILDGRRLNKQPRASATGTR